MKRLIALIAGLLVLGHISSAPAQQSVVVPATTNQIAVAGTVAGRTKIITGVNGKSIYITALHLAPVATAAVTFSYGTGSDCGTGTGTLSGVLTFAAGQTVNLGSGYGAVMVVPQSNDLCITIGTATAPGILAYSIF